MRMKKVAECTSKSHKDTIQITPCSRTNLMSQGYHDDNHDHEGKQRAATSSPCNSLHVKTQNIEQTNTSHHVENKQISKRNIGLPSILNLHANIINIAGKGNQAMAKDMSLLNTDNMITRKSDSSKSHDDMSMTTPCARTNLMSQVNHDDNHEHKGRQGATTSSPHKGLHVETQKRDQTNIRNQNDNNLISKGSFCLTANLNVPTNKSNFAGDECLAMEKDWKIMDTTSNNGTDLSNPVPREQDRTGSCNHLIPRIPNQQDLVDYFQSEDFCDKAKNLNLLGTFGRCREELCIPVPSELELITNTKFDICNNSKLRNQRDMKLHSNKQCQEIVDSPGNEAGCTSTESMDTKDQLHSKELELKDIGRRRHFDPG